MKWKIPTRIDISSTLYRYLHHVCITFAGDVTSSSNYGKENKIEIVIHNFAA